MATINWTSIAGGDWSDAGAWSGGVVPGASDDAVIQGSANYTVTVTKAEAADSLTVNNPSALVSISTGGALSLGSGIDLESGDLRLSQGGVISGGTLSSSGGAFQFKGGALEGLTYDGTLDLSPASSAVTIAGAGLVLSGAGGTGAGQIDLTGSGSSMFVAGNQTLDNATFDLGGNSNLIQLQTTSASGTLTLGLSLTIDQTGPASIQDEYRTAGDKLINEGTINSPAGDALELNLVDFVNEGTVAVGDGDDFSVVGSGGFVNAAGAVFTIASGNVVALKTQAWTLGGTLDGGGQLTVPTATVAGLVVGGGAQLIDDGTVTQTGTLTLGDSTGGTGKLTIANKYAYGIAGNFDILSGTSTASRIVVDGTLTRTSGAGLAAVEVAVSDNGVIKGAAGVFDFSKSITGSGALEIGGGATLRFGGVVAATLTATFEAPGGTLALTRATAFDATIAGFAPGGTIDLINKAATKVTLEAGDKLLVQNGTVTVADLQLSGVFTGDTFHLSSDGKGGTNVTVTSGSDAAPHALIQAMAALAPSSPAVSGQSASAVSASHTAMLAFPASHAS